jgi:hypothetical protein
MALPPWNGFRENPQEATAHTLDRISHGAGGSLLSLLEMRGF